MATRAVLTPHDVSTTLNYYTSIGTEAPYKYRGVEPPAGKPMNNIGTDWCEVVVHDARGHEQEFSLDENGFEFMHWECGEKDAVFDDEKLIRDRYYPKVEELLKQVTGARRVFIFSHIVRRPAGKGDPNVTRVPVERVHNDYTFEQGPRFVRYLLPTEADRLLEDRVRMINVWRPISHPVVHHPLGMLDWRCVDEDDFVSVRSVIPNFESSSYSFRYNTAHRWHYLSSQTPEEVTLIKCYDSAVDKARCCPHTAFPDASSPKEAPGRESIEVRTLVFDAE